MLQLSANIILESIICEIDAKRRLFRKRSMSIFIAHRASNQSRSLKTESRPIGQLEQLMLALFAQEALQRAAILNLHASSLSDLGRIG